MNLKTWIKLFRKFKEWEHYKDNNVKSVMLDLMLDAYSIPTKRNGKSLEAAQVDSTIEDLQESLGLSRHIIIKALKTLERSGEITRESVGRKKIIKINAFVEYQLGADNTPNQCRKCTNTSAENAPIENTTSAENAPYQCRKCTNTSAENAPIHLIYDDNKLSSINKNINENILETRSIIGAGENLASSKEPKIGYEKFGEDGLVELKPVEHRALVERYGEDAVKNAIEDLNDKLAAGGNDNLNNAQSHYHVLRYWLRYRKDSGSAKPQPRKIDLNALKHN